MPCNTESHGRKNANTLLGRAGCELLYAWALGGDVLTLPLSAGVKIGNDATRFIVIETYMSNPTGARAMSPVKLGLKMQTASRLRQYDAAVLSIGDPHLSLRHGNRIAAQQDTVHYETTCASACTSNFLGDIYVYGSFLHMHAHGRKMWTTLSKYNEDSDTILSMDIIDHREFWNYRVQHVNPSSAVISQGDKLNTHCIYDTTNSDKALFFGVSTDQEMCIHHLFVYPASHLTAKYCGRSDGGYSVCSNTADQANIICKINPAPDGTTDIPEQMKFGTASNTSEAHRRTATVVDSSSVSPEEYDSQLSQLTCQLYRFKEYHQRNIRLSAAVGMTVVLMCFCSIFAAIVYCMDRKSAGLNSIEDTVLSVIPHGDRFNYEMVAVDEESKSASQQSGEMTKNV